MRSHEVRVYHILTALEDVPKSWLNGITLGVVLILGAIDYLTGVELSISFFYFIPVSAAAWVLGKHTGLTYSVLSATICLASNLFSGQIFSNIFIGVWNTLIHFGFYGVFTILLTELRSALEEEHLLANTDLLTGAMNRRSFNELAEKRMILAEVNKRPYTVVYIDLDNFKPINDKQGHSIGDLVLKAVVDTIQKQIRIADFFARFGGDEFAILLADIGEEDAKRIVQRLRKALLERMDMHVWDVTFSIGALTFLTMPHSVEEMIRLTDELMYEVKTNGKNSIKYSVYEW